MFTCNRCGIYKPISAFHVSKRSKHGHSTQCAACLKLYHDSYLQGRKKSPNGFEQCEHCNVVLNLGTNWRRCHFTAGRLVCRPCSSISQSRKTIRVSLATTMFHLARQRARARGIEFDISKADILIPERCPVLGIELSGGTGKQHDGSPTLDRIDPSKGYVKGNIAVISHRANRLKNNASLTELKALVAWVTKVSVSE